MLILHKIKIPTILFGEVEYTVYIGSSGNKFIFNVAPSTDPKPTGGYPSLRNICYMKGIQLKDMSPIVKKAEEIMGRTLAENMATQP